MPAKLIFTLGGDTFTWDVFPLYPEDNPASVNVPVDYSEGGQLYAYDKGIEEKEYRLTFDNATADDYSNFDDWLRNVAVGPKNTFTYTDRDSANHTVRLMNVKNPLRKVDVSKFAGTVILRKEIT